MKRIIKNICVFGAASDVIPDKYKHDAYRLGELIAKQGIGLVFGAGDSGLMGQVARGVKAHGGRVTGIIPERLNAPGVAYPHCTELIVTETMHSRKAAMEEASDAFIALPGGFGTLEELMEVITLKQLGYIDCPVCVLNSYSYYDRMNEQFISLINEGFADSSNIELYYLANSPEDALEHILNYISKPIVRHVPLQDV